MAPLLRAILRLSGHQPLTDFLLSFRYPLAGECAVHRDLLCKASLRSGWDLEIGMLCEVFRIADPRLVCQVDGGSGYDHKHQPLLGGLKQMCREIAACLFTYIRMEGVAVDSWGSALAEAYRKESDAALRRSAALAFINGLPFDEEGETEIVEAFAGVFSDPGLLTQNRNGLPLLGSEYKRRDPRKMPASC